MSIPAAVGIDSAGLALVTAVVGAAAIYGCSKVKLRGDDRGAQNLKAEAGVGKRITHIDFAAKPFHESVEVLFKHADKNGDGTVSRRELKLACRGEPEFMKELGLHRVHGSKDFFAHADSDKSATLTLAEFRKYLEDVEASVDRDAERRAKLVLTKQDDEIIEEAFLKMDVDSDNAITEAELAAGFVMLSDMRGRKMAPASAKQHAKKAMRHYNASGGGELDLADFQLMVLRCPFADIFGAHQPK